MRGERAGSFLPSLRHYLAHFIAIHSTISMDPIEENLILSAHRALSLRNGCKCAYRALISCRSFPRRNRTFYSITIKEAEWEREDATGSKQSEINYSLVAAAPAETRDETRTR